jgi:hypothetical protein
MLDCPPLTVYAVTVNGVFAATTSPSCEELSEVTVILASCEGPERKSTAAVFNGLPVSTKRLLSGTFVSQARNTKPASPAERSPRIVVLFAPPPVFNGPPRASHE